MYVSFACPRCASAGKVPQLAGVRVFTCPACACHFRLNRVNVAIVIDDSPPSNQGKLGMPIKASASAQRPDSRQHNTLFVRGAAILACTTLLIFFGRMLWMSWHRLPIPPDAIPAAAAFAEQPTQPVKCHGRCQLRSTGVGDLSDCYVIEISGGFVGYVKQDSDAGRHLLQRLQDGDWHEAVLKLYFEADKHSPTPRTHAIITDVVAGPD
ncbi:MAG TPA: hypothetical protein VFA18_20590 [Gemmataceae bacterium]|nr:hypothetical protein [Gemmataceae bacterium]